MSDLHKWTWWSANTWIGHCDKPQGAINWISLLTCLHSILLHKINTSALPTNDAYMHCETCSVMMSYPAMSLGYRLCVSRKGDRGRVGEPLVGHRLRLAERVG